MVGIVGNNNVEHFSVLWATTQKNFCRYAQQRGELPHRRTVLIFL
jgi:hypothetical protein